MRSNPIGNSSAASLKLAGIRHLMLLAALCAATSAIIPQLRAADDPANRRRGGTDDASRRGGSPEDMQARMLNGLRERFEVTDDEEWKLISERLSKVMELRRSAASSALGAFAGGRGGPPGGGGTSGGDRGNRTAGSTRGGSSNPEVAALTAALRDKLPDAEIKSRLERVREVRKNNEAKLTKAQEDLRAVLSVRQEATAVMFGLLP